jgi:DNA-binding IclR family transcriptional regulator
MPSAISIATSMVRGVNRRSPRAMTCVGAPLFGGSSDPVGAISITGTVRRFSKAAAIGAARTAALGLSPVLPVL